MHALKLAGRIAVLLSMPAIAFVLTLTTAISVSLLANTKLGFLHDSINQRGLMVMVALYFSFLLVLLSICVRCMCGAGSTLLYLLRLGSALPLLAGLVGTYLGYAAVQDGMAAQLGGRSLESLPILQQESLSEMVEVGRRASWRSAVIGAILASVTCALVSTQAREKRGSEKKGGQEKRGSGLRS
jgi:hypothetical protein